MNIAELFIRRPVMTALVMLGIVIFGIAGYRALPVSDLPNVDFPTIQVNAALPGASPEMMAASVATPLTLRKVNPADQPIPVVTMNSSLDTANAVVYADRAAIRDAIGTRRR